ncbi:glucan endo-1,3-beta-glucosidase 5 [Senna tora]|uniref:glucan endo-1,3-beta-D-glucosidase n=1 Tax=Senna tora TaxID=362788 RepID=A0A835CDK2_9FABA|nr:glucan endo-1,3-beta-glucosidase 5 [Senna tora]
MGLRYVGSILLGVMIWMLRGENAKGVEGYACNWGRVSSRPLQASVTVQLMKDNKFTKAKLFDVDDDALKALANSGIQVMVGIPNDGLAPLVNDSKAAEEWVAQNVSAYIKSGVDIRYVAVSNEAFLKDYKDKYIYDVLPVCKNIYNALEKAGMLKKVDVTVPLNADIYESYTGLPSGGDFRYNVKNVVVPLLKFLNDKGFPVAINIYPFLSLYYSPQFPKEYAFFNSTSNTLYDGKYTYTNAFDGNLDTLAASLEKNELGSMGIIVGEVGWPTDGNINANNENAQRFYQGLIDRINKKQGTPKRPDDMPDVYMFGLLDEDAKSTLPGNFEPHWGIFNYDGSIKYQLDLGNGDKLVAAKGVKYMKKQWCVLSPNANIYDPKMKDNWNIACGTSTGCTSVGNGSSCGEVDDRTKASFAFNAFYQVTNQDNKEGCKFNGLTIVTDKDPSPSNGTCKFNVALDPSTSPPPHSRKSHPGSNSMATPTTYPNSLLLAISIFLMLSSV